jgi:hypothetical protein
MLWPSKKHARRVCQALSCEVGPLPSADGLVVVEEVIDYAQEVREVLWTEVLSSVPQPDPDEEEDDEEDEEADDEDEDEDDDD